MANVLEGENVPEESADDTGYRAACANVAQRNVTNTLHSFLVGYICIIEGKSKHD